jgi:hypothetical protein
VALLQIGGNTMALLQTGGQLFSKPGQLCGTSSNWQADSSNWLAIGMVFFTVEENRRKQH